MRSSIVSLLILACHILELYCVCSASVGHVSYTLSNSVWTRFVFIYVHCCIFELYTYSRVIFRLVQTLLVLMLLSYVTMGQCVK